MHLERYQLTVEKQLEVEAMKATVDIMRSMQKTGVAGGGSLGIDGDNSDENMNVADVVDTFRLIHEGIMSVFL